MLRGGQNQEIQDRITSLHDRLCDPASCGTGTISSLPKPGSDKLGQFARSVREIVVSNTARDERLILSDARLAVTADTIATAIPNAEFLALITSPRELIARTLGKSDPDLLLETWIASARCVLTLAHRFRSRVRVLLAQDCLDYPREFEAFLRGEIGVAAASPHPVQKKIPALEQALAQLIVAKHQEAKRLDAELFAASHPLGDNVSGMHQEQINLGEATAELSSLRSSPALHDLTTENELLLKQLHQVQEELEHYFLEARRLENSAKKHDSEASAIWEYGSLTLGEAHHEPPHRHLNFALDEAGSGDRIFGNIRLRLLEHHGRPGILLFQSQGDQPAILHHWQQSGEEEGTPYMIVIPQDKAGADFLLASTTSDLLLIRGILRLLRAQLGNDPANNLPHASWKRLTGRLLEQIDDLPERLHYDAVNCKLTPREKSWDCKFAVSNAWFHGYGVAEISANWSSTNYAAITLSYSGNEAPLTVWPADANRVPDREMLIDLSSSRSRKDMAIQSAAMTRRDRALLCNLISELPNFLVHLSIQHPDAGLDLGKLQKQARNFARLAKKHFLST